MELTGGVRHYHVQVPWFSPHYWMAGVEVFWSLQSQVLFVIGMVFILQCGF